MSGVPNQNKEPKMTKKLSLLSLLNNNNFATYNRALALEIGLNAAIFLHELVNKYDFFSDQLVTINGVEGYFYLQSDDAYERTALSKREQTTAIQKLIELSFITQVNKGIPQTRYFKIHEERIQEFLGIKEMFTKSAKTQIQKCENANLEVRKRKSHIYKETQEEKHVRETLHGDVQLRKDLLKALKSATDVDWVLDQYAIHKAYIDERADNLVGYLVECFRSGALNNLNFGKSKAEINREIAIEIIAKVGDQTPLRLGKDFLEFSGSGGFNGVYINFSEKNFEEKVYERLEKMGISIPTSW